MPSQKKAVARAHSKREGKFKPMTKKKHFNALSISDDYKPI
jgi:hypothetical protein